MRSVRRFVVAIGAAVGLNWRSRVVPRLHVTAVMGAVAPAMRAAGTAANPHTQQAGVDTAVDGADTAGIATVTDVAAGASDSSIRSGIRIPGIHIPGSTTATTIRTLYVAPPVAPMPPADSYAAPPAAPALSYWYYCPDSKTYYPYVRQCASAWERVAPTPAR